MVLLGDMKSPDDLLRIVQKTFSSLVAPFRIQGKEIPITVSIGFCMYPYDGTNAEELVAHSEEAMDHAKDLGRNTYSLYNERMNREALLRIKVEQELTKALKADEVLIHYQPKVDRFGRLQGMEALARWNSPVLGSVPPTVFIPVAERCGLIIPLGDLVLKKVCAQILEWGRLGHDFGRIAVNLSPFQLSRPGLVPSILETLRTHRISPERMEFEITETGLMENEGEGIERINQLTKLGFLVSVDDFGTGYSNLSKLKSYPIHTLKIDK
jgi:predicted signal transduction protein with EAL and GGDEF domain